MKFEFRPEVEVLLENDTSQKVKMEYMNHTWTMPKLSHRPPFYNHPEYEFSFPKL